MNPPRVRFASLSLIAATVVFVCVATSDRWLSTNTSAQIATWQDKVEPKVLNAAMAGETQFLVYLNSQADLSGASRACDEGRERRIRLRTPERRPLMPRSPRCDKRSLNSARTYKSFWVTNAIWAKGSLAVVQAVAVRPEVAYIYASGGGSIKSSTDKSTVNLERSDNLDRRCFADPSPEANLLNVNADDVWARGIAGQGAVVAGADTGVRWDHAALKKQYRGWNNSAGSE